MTTGRELFEIWAPRGAIWSHWVAPAMFAQMHHRIAPAGINHSLPSATWHEQRATADTAIVVDLPGADAIRLAISLAQRGYRPVPIINASPGPLQSLLTTSPRRQVAALDMHALVTEICSATPFLQQISLAPDAPPAFILDSWRSKGTHPLREDMFDNRWMVFPQDFPSARFLGERKIKRVILVQTEETPPLDDLSHVLLRWQEAGIEILATSTREPGTPLAITVARPSRFKAIWYRALAMLGFRRSSAGGFGSFLPQNSGGG